jgi:hypothetical protein
MIIPPTCQMTTPQDPLTGEEYIAIPAKLVLVKKGGIEIHN